jgi:SulP family sulfate permease
MDIPDMAREFAPRRLIPNLASGLIVGVINIVIMISFAALIFSGDLAGHVASGIGLALFGAFVIGIVVALTSSFSGMLAGPQDIPAAILALVVASIVRNGTSRTGETTFVTIVVAIALTSILTGIFFLALGRFKLGKLVRFVPYPVIGGFIAGTGWLLVKGSISVMTDTTLDLQNLYSLFQPSMLIRWLPGLCLAILILSIMRYRSNVLVIPVTVLSAIALFYILLRLSNVSVSMAGAQGWLLGPFPKGALWPPFSFSAIGQVDWHEIFGQIDKIGTLLVLAVMSLLLYASGLELTVKQDIDVNRELQSCGIANIIAGLGGGMAGYIYLGDTILVYKMGVRSRLVGLFSALLCGAALFLGASYISFFPKPVLGGLLLFLGFSFLVEWFYDAWFKLPKIDYFLILLISVIVGVFGFLQGVAAGMGIAIILFVIQYSQVNVVKQVLSGENYRSNVDRPLSHRQILNKKGNQAYILLQLQGFIFFGTAHSLLNQIQQRMKEHDLPRLRFVVLDFHQVSGLDSSAVSSFSRLKQLAEANNIQLVFTRLTPEMKCLLEIGGLIDGHDEIFRILPTLEHGAEWCENKILAEENLSLNEPDCNLLTQLKREFHNAGHIVRLMDYLEKFEVNGNYSIIHQGDQSDALYFLESGLVTVQLELRDGTTVRLRAIQSGTIVGEMGLYLDDVRSATVITICPSTLYRLSASSLNLMEERDPRVAAELHRWIARLLAERLDKADKTLEAVLG